LTSEGNNKMMKKEVIAPRMAMNSIFKVDLDIGCMGINGLRNVWT